MRGVGETLARPLGELSTGLRGAGIALGESLVSLTDSLGERLVGLTDSLRAELGV